MKNPDNASILIGVLALAFYFVGESFLFKSLAIKDFYSNGEQGYTVSNELFKPDNNNGCEYNYEDKQYTVAVKNKIDRSYTCCDWPDEKVPVRMREGKIQALCGVWPMTNIITMERNELANLNSI